MTDPACVEFERDIHKTRVPSRVRGLNPHAPPHPAVVAHTLVLSLRVATPPSGYSATARSSKISLRDDGGGDSETIRSQLAITAESLHRDLQTYVRSVGGRLFQGVRPYGS